MSLASLVNGADCGPSTALQSLTKRIDADRGIQQVDRVINSENANLII
jgi:peroxin-5